MSTTASPNDTVVVTDGLIIDDGNGNQWIIDNGQVAETTVVDGTVGPTVVDPDTANVVAIALVNGFVWQLNAQGLWWAKTGGPGSYDGWTSGPGTDNSSGTRVSPLPPSPSGTWITSGLSIYSPTEQANPAPLVDAGGNLYWISGSGQVVENGIVDSSTANVIGMTYFNGVIWQENASNLWWAKTGGPGAYDNWTSGPGTYNSDGTYAPPFPIGLTWIGGGTNEASNPADWNLPTVPAPGDGLTMNGGTMNVVGNVLAGDTVSLVSSESPNIPTPTLNLSGRVAMSVGTNAGPGGVEATINLADHSRWVGSINASNSTITIAATGDGTGRFANVDSFINNETTIDANVVGSGAFTVIAQHSYSKLEFMHSVGAGQSILASGGYTGASIVQIDTPGAFHASVSLGDGILNLEGLEATSYSFANGILSLFNGNALVDTMKLSLVTTGEYGGEYGATDFGVSQTASGVSVLGDAYGTLLPLHS